MSDEYPMTKCAHRPLPRHRPAGTIAGDRLVIGHWSLRLLWLLVIGSLVIVEEARAFVYETPYELQADGDFDGDGRRDLIIVDKATGNYRIAYQLAPGTYTWVSPRASGVPNATGLGIGKLTSLSFDSLAVT